MIRAILLTLLLISCAGVKLDQRIINQMSMIEIAEVGSIQEAMLYQRLFHILRSAGDTKYLLEFKINYHQNDIGLSKESDIIRKGITQVINFKLTNKEDDRVLLKRTIVMRSSYSLATDAMVSYAQLDSNKNFLAINGADKIYAHLIIYFKSMFDKL